VDRATVGSGELTKDELMAGALVLERKLGKYRIGAVGILGVSAYRKAFDDPHAQMGPQQKLLAGALVWVLPNPSGLNAHFTPPAIAASFRAFRLATEKNG
jgi:TDG/mug DNA glycosylase family protein